MSVTLINIHSRLYVENIDRYIGINSEAVGKPTDSKRSISEADANRIGKQQLDGSELSNVTRQSAICGIIEFMSGNDGRVVGLSPPSSGLPKSYQILVMKIKSNKRKLRNLF